MQNEEDNHDNSNTLRIGHSQTIKSMSESLLTLQVSKKECCSELPKYKMDPGPQFRIFKNKGTFRKKVYGRTDTDEGHIVRL